MDAEFLIADAERLRSLENHRNSQNRKLADAEEQLRKGVLKSGGKNTPEVRKAEEARNKAREERDRAAFAVQVHRENHVLLRDELSRIEHNNGVSDLIEKMAGAQKQLSTVADLANQLGSAVFKAVNRLDDVVNSTIDREFKLAFRIFLEDQLRQLVFDEIRHGGGRRIAGDFPVGYWQGSGKSANPRRPRLVDRFAGLKVRAETMYLPEPGSQETGELLASVRD